MPEDKIAPALTKLYDAVARSAAWEDILYSWSEISKSVGDANRNKLLNKVITSAEKADREVYLLKYSEILAGVEGFDPGALTRKLITNVSAGDTQAASYLLAAPSAVARYALDNHYQRQAKAAFDSALSEAAQGVFSADWMGPYIAVGGTVEEIRDLLLGASYNVKSAYDFEWYKEFCHLSNSASKPEDFVEELLEDIVTVAYPYGVNAETLRSRRGELKRQILRQLASGGDLP